MPWDWVEGWDPYNIWNAQNAWSQFTGSGDFGLSTSTKRTGRCSFRVGNVGFSEGGGERLFTSVVTTGLMVVFSMAAGSASSGATNDANVGFQLYNNTSGNRIRVDSNGSGQLRLRNNTTTLHTTGTIVTASTFIPQVIILTGGNILWYVNGTLEYSAAAPSLGAGQIDRIRCCSDGNVSSFSYYYDDIGVCIDPTTNEINEVVNSGAIPAVYIVYPDSDISPQDWVPSNGGDAYVDISEAPVDVGDYIEAFAANDESRFGIPNLNASVPISTVHAVQHSYRARKTTAGAGTVQGSLFSNNVQGAGADNPLFEAGQYWYDMLNLNPDGGATWTPADLSALNTYYERTA